MQQSNPQIDSSLVTLFVSPLRNKTEFILRAQRHNFNKKKLESVKSDGIFLKTSLESNPN